MSGAVSRSNVVSPAGASTVTVGRTLFQGDAAQLEKRCTYYG